MQFIVGRFSTFACIGCGKIHLKKVAPVTETVRLTDKAGNGYDVPILNCSECPEDKIATSRNSIDRATVEWQRFLDDHKEFASKRKQIEVQP